MSLTEFDALTDGDAVEFTNPVSGRVSRGTARRVSADEVEVAWSDGARQTLLRHQVRIFADLYRPFRRVPPP